MASKNFENVSNFDWDDSALIKAYNKGTQLRKKGYQETKNPEKGNPSKENVKAENQWKVGDLCRAVYSADQCVYEAKICSIQDGHCVVEFLGYGGKEIVDLSCLLESAGKKARKRQTKTALAGLSTASDSCLTNDGDTASHRCTSASHSQTAASHSQTAASHIHTAASHPHATVNHLHAAACYAPPAVPSNMPFLPAPQAPPMPQCPSVAQDPALSSMMVSWYMAGYYTGLHQGQKGSQCSQHCCSHVNRCCH